MSTSFSQDSSSGRVWQRGRHPATAGGLRPRLLLLAGGWAAGVATEYYFERNWGARATPASLSSTSTKGLKEPAAAPTRGTTARPQAPPSPSAAHAAPAAQQSPATSSPGNAAPAQTGAAAVWRDAPAHALSNPGGNPVVTRKGTGPGRSFYDHVESADALTTWQQVLRSEEMRRYNFVDLDRNNDGFLEHDDLRRAFGVTADVEALIKTADTDLDGKISYKEWLMLKAKLAEAYEKGERESQAQAKARAQKKEEVKRE